MIICTLSVDGVPYQGTGKRPATAARRAVLGALRADLRPGAWTLDELVELTRRTGVKAGLELEAERARAAARAGKNNLLRD